MTIPHQDDFHGVIVHRHAPEDNGYLEFPLRFGVPDGGWHSRELIEAAIERQILNPTTQSRTWNRDLVKPLAGLFDWTEGDEQFVVHSSDQGDYTLRSRPASQQYTSAGRRRGFGDGEGLLLATFKAKDLHLAVSGALQQVSHAITAEPCPEIPAPTMAEIEQHQDALSEASAAVQRAVEGELHARSDEERERYRDTARSLHDRIMELREETATLQRRQRPEHFRILSAGQIPWRTHSYRDAQRQREHHERWPSPRAPQLSGFEPGIGRAQGAFGDSEVTQSAPRSDSSARGLEP
jgi:hypothetical protein